MGLRPIQVDENVSKFSVEYKGLGDTAEVVP
jgi:hypothetical protein